MKKILIASVLAAAVLGAAELTAANSPEPVFSANKYVCGNKNFTWNNGYDNIIYSCGGKKIFGVQSRMSPSDPGWAPFMKFEVQSDDAAKTVTRTCPFTVKNGPKGTFRQTFRMLPDKRLEISSHFDAPSTEVKWGKIFSLNFPVKEAYGMKMESVRENGAVRKFTMHDKENWGHKKSLWANTCCFNFPKKMVFFPDVPQKRFVMEIEPGTVLRIVVFRSNTECVLNFEFRKEIDKPLVLRFDLGQDVKTE